LTEEEADQGGTDAEAFEAAYAECADAVFRYALRRSANEADAQDVMAETFAVAWRRVADMPTGRELPWLYGVARRVLANQRRTSGRVDRLRTRLRFEPGPDPGPASENGTARRVLERLSLNDRELLRLAMWEELTPAELAVALDITENAVYIRLHRARQRFAALFEQELGGPR
jgi:RNA polymerase sigma-70 factor (ECF subfamily)